MTKKIFRSTLLVAAIVLLCSLGIIMGVLYNYFDNILTSQLQDELRIAAVGTELEGIRFLDSLDAEDYRLTWIAADGTVLFDTAADTSSMDNHANRDEIQQALLNGAGSATRYSDTLMERTIYEAVRLSDGTVLRISRNERTMLVLVVGMLHPFVVVIVIAIIISAILAHRMSKKIVQPMNDLDLDHPLANDAYEELTPLLRRINQQHLQITAQMRTLIRKTDEFDQITASMQEGLVVLDSEGNILSINSMARAIFEIDQDCVGKNFLILDRTQEIRAAVNTALDSGNASVLVQKGGRQYQFEMNRIASDGKTVGAVVLGFDVTERMNAEQTRREFSANVSHELKTPLQSIIGSAELMENGLVKPEDMPRFIDHIRKEASRLVNLVEDIIRLSQLDEGVDIPYEEVDLLDISVEIVDVLKRAAAAKSVTVAVHGEPCRIQGVRRLLYEIVYNLCDNAIKYNKPDGSVQIRVQSNSLTVSDTGIGIPPEHHERVFERFYRVDKSHSKQSGGTGLGLSIVKHAVQYHNAKIQLHSVPGEGTTISILF